MSKTPPHRIQMPAPLTAADLSNNNALTDTSPSVFGGRNSPSVFDSVRSHAASSAAYGRRRSNRASFATQRTRRGSRATMIIHDDMTDLGDGEEGEVKLPTLVPGIRPAYSTPLPTLPMAVLCIVSARLGTSSLSGNAIGATVCQSVHSVHPQDGRRYVTRSIRADVGFYLNAGYEKNSETEAEVGLWTGKSTEDHSKLVRS
jgi:hypothetical protein